METNIYIILVGAGFLIFIFSIIKSTALSKAVHSTPAAWRHLLGKLMLVYHLIQAGLSICYLLIVYGLFQNIERVNFTLLSITLLSGAIYGLLGAYIQSLLFKGLGNTLHGVIAICASCNKIRTGNDKPGKKAVWVRLEDFICSKADVHFTHGFCPECYEKEKEKVRRK